LDHEIVNEAQRRVVIWQKMRRRIQPATAPHNIDRASLTPRRPDGIAGLFAELGIAPFSPR
jgi:hypothetical protein